MKLILEMPVSAGNHSPTAMTMAGVWRRTIEVCWTTATPSSSRRAASISVTCLNGGGLINISSSSKSNRPHTFTSLKIRSFATISTEPWRIGVTLTSSISKLTADWGASTSHLPVSTSRWPSSQTFRSILIQRIVSLSIWRWKTERPLGSFPTAIPTELGDHGVNFWCAICLNSYRWTFTADALRRKRRNAPIDPFATRCSLNIIGSICVSRIHCVRITSRRNATDRWRTTRCPWFTADPIIPYFFRPDPTSTPWILTVPRVWRIISRNWWPTTNSTWVTSAGDGSMWSIRHPKIRGVSCVGCWEILRRNLKLTILHLGGPANWSTTPVCYRRPNLLFLLNADNDCIDFFKILFKYTTFNAVINKLAHQMNILPSQPQIHLSKVKSASASINLMRDDNVKSSSIISNGFQPDAIGWRSVFITYSFSSFICFWSSLSAGEFRRNSCIL